MNFFHRLRLAWRILWYRGPWLPRYADDEPGLFDYPPDVMPEFSAPGSGGEIKLVPVDTPMLKLIPRQPCTSDLHDWKPIEFYSEQRKETQPCQTDFLTRAYLRRISQHPML